MTATVIPFPTRAPPARVVPESAHELAMDLLRDLYLGGLRGDAESLRTLERIGRSHSNCEIARLARMASEDLRPRGGEVVPPCECETGSGT